MRIYYSMFMISILWSITIHSMELSTSKKRKFEWLHKFNQKAAPAIVAEPRETFAHIIQTLADQPLKNRPSHTFIRQCTNIKDLLPKLSEEDLNHRIAKIGNNTALEMLTFTLLSANKKKATKTTKIILETMEELIKNGANPYLENPQSNQSAVDWMKKSRDNNFYLNQQFKRICAFSKQDKEKIDQYAQFHQLKDTFNKFAAMVNPTSKKTKTTELSK